MSKSNFLYFLVPAIIWSSTWYVIKYQLGVVDPIVSVAYRFGLGGIMLLIYSKLKNISTNFSLKEHAFIALQGFFLFGANYWCVYESELYLSSGLVAVGFSTLIFMNIFFSAIFLGDSIKKKTLIGAFLGLSGTILIYLAEFQKIVLTNDIIKGILLCFVSITLASLGNITSSYNQRKFSIPVLQSNGFGMLYGAIIMLLIAVITRRSLNFDFSMPYVFSLLYLTIFGSIVAFTAYLILIGRVGAGKAAYVIVVIPILALTISTIFENYKLDGYAFLGIVLILAGNVFALKKKKIYTKG